MTLCSMHGSTVFFDGTSPTTFDPNGTMTRGMFVTVLGRMAGIDAAAYAGQSVFSDVPANMYCTPYVAWAAKHDITGGTGEGKFSPNALIAKGQTADCVYGIFNANMKVDNGNVQAIAESADTNTDTTYFSYGHYVSINIGANGEFTAQGYTKALNVNLDIGGITLATGITADASTAYAGTGSVTYVKNNNDTYKWYYACSSHNH